MPTSCVFWQPRFFLLAVGGLLGVWTDGTTFAQAPDVRRPSLGHPVVRSIAPQAYDGHGEVWDVAQDERGLLYIASSYGLQQYDGARWRFLSTSNGTTPWAIARDSSGTLYVGARNQLGRYRPDSLGNRTYRSLLAHVPSTHRPTGSVRDVVLGRDGVLFRTEKGVLRWTGTDMQAVTDTAATGMHACGGTAYLRTLDGALKRIEGRTTVSVSETALRDASIAGMVRGASGGCQVIAESGAHFAVTASGLDRRPLPGGPAGDPIVDAVRGPGGALALATQTAVRLVGPEGTFHRVRRREGLPDGPITALYVSERQALWVATKSGLARVAWPDPVTMVDNSDGTQGISHSGMTRHNGTLVVGSTQGLWRREGGSLEKWAAVGHVDDVLSTERGILVAGTEGIFAIRENEVRSLSSAAAYVLQRSRQDASVVYAGLEDNGLLRVQRQANEWRIADRTDRVDTPIFTMGQDSTGALWLGTGHKGVIRLGPPLRPLADAPITRFDTTDGLPAPSFNYTTQVREGVRFITRDGLYRRTASTFGPDERFAPVYADDVRMHWPVVDGPNGEVWMDFGGHKLGVARGGAGDSLRWTERPFRRLADLGDVSGLYPDGDSLVWMGAERVLVRYDRRLRRYGGHAQPFRTLLRGVRTRDDSLLYGGDTEAERLPADVGFAHNDLRFQFGATSYERVDGPLHTRDRPRQYRWRLVGFDEEWTDWTTEARADYTGLPPGSYTMRVEARNLYNVVGSEARLSFTVLPPWYRTWGAYAGYALLVLVLGIGTVRWRTRRLRRRQAKLEDTVAERTEQIRQKNDQLARQAERLQELDEAKSRFFANITHEFRTPLTLIRGPVQEVREQIERGAVEIAVPDRADAAVESTAQLTEQLGIVERNTARLQRLIDQILGLARLDAGTYELAARPTDLREAVGEIARSVQPLAERKGLALDVAAETGSVDERREPVYVDREALEHVVTNLLSNAVKFTPEGGRVTVTVEETAEHAAITVRDTGVGIPEAEQDAIFDRFAQVDDAPTHEQEGAGIGLAFASDLVELHGGTLTVDSNEGEGTTVTARFPWGSDHLSDDQRASAPPPNDDTPENRPSAPQPSNLQSTLPDEGAPDDTGAASTETAEPQNSTSKLVLVVDDNADVRRYVRSILEPTFEVIEAADGEAGTRKAREHLPDVILADVMMPGTDGHAMTRRLKDDPETEAIPVIMVTARAETQDEVEGLRVGADDYVTKPFDTDVLEQRIRGVVAMQERLRRRVRERLREEGAAEAEEEAEPARSEFEQRARAAIRRHLSDPDFGIEALAEALHVSRTTLYRRFDEKTDTTPADLLKAVRIEHAAELLREEEGTVTQIAYAVGYERLSDFSDQFQAHTGTRPSRYAESR